MVPGQHMLGEFNVFPGMAPARTCEAGVFPYPNTLRISTSAHAVQSRKLTQMMARNVALVVSVQR